MLFLLVAMTYIKLMEERQLFDACGLGLVGQRVLVTEFVLITVYWHFAISAGWPTPADGFADVGAVLLKVGEEQVRILSAWLYLTLWWQPTQVVHFAFWRHALRYGVGKEGVVKFFAEFFDLLLIPAAYQFSRCRRSL